VRWVYLTAIGLSMTLGWNIALEDTALAAGVFGLSSFDGGALAPTMAYTRTVSEPLSMLLLGTAMIGLARTLRRPE
jgi:hypothetical protein